MAGYVVGTLVSYDVITLENTVTVLGRDLRDVAVLGTLQAWTLRPGDLVALTRDGSVILGRVLSWP